MKRTETILIVFLIALYGISARAQVNEKAGTFDLINLERHQFTVNLLGPGFRYELGILKNVSASTSFTPGIATYDKRYSFGYAWHTRIRYYHNLKTRLDINKNVIGNSANYLAPARSIFYGPLQISQNLKNNNDFAVAFYGGVYGIQRTYKKGFNFNAELGYGYYSGDGVRSGYGPLVNLTLGWVLGKKKKKDDEIEWQN